jgi:hypothetical protein
MFNPLTSRRLSRPLTGLTALQERDCHGRRRSNPGVRRRDP